MSIYTLIDGTSAPSVECAYAIAAKSTHEITKFQNYVLPGARFRLIGTIVRTTDVIRSKEYYCERDVSGVDLKLFNDCTP